MQQFQGDKIREEYEISFNDFQQKLEVLDKYYRQQQKLHEKTPSIDEDREQIKQLQQDVQDRDYEIIKLNQEIKYLQQELLNRDQSDYLNLITDKNAGRLNQTEEKQSHEIKQLKQQLQFQEEEINYLNQKLIKKDNIQNVHTKSNQGILNFTDNDKVYILKKKQQLEPRRSHVVLKQ